MADIRPFRFAVPQSDLDDLARRLEPYLLRQLVDSRVRDRQVISKAGSGSFGRIIVCELCVRYFVVANQTANSNKIISSDSRLVRETTDNIPMRVPIF